MTAPEIIQRIWMPPLWEVGDGIIPTDGQCELDDVSYILATPEALAASLEVQALIAEAEINVITSIEMEWRSQPALDAARRNLRSRIETIRALKKGE